MNLHRLAQQRAAAGRPVRVGLIGAGKFGSMFLSQVPRMAGLDVTVIADLDPEQARAACVTVGWDVARIAKTLFVASGTEACAHPEIEVVVEATGVPAAGIAHARAAIRAKKHIVMVNVESRRAGRAAARRRGAGRRCGLFARLWRPTGACL
jgi:predicted homoserine dehydrogenase-like protein